MAQERCIRKTAQFGRLWYPGEVRTIDKTNDDGLPIVSSHFRLVEDEEKVDEKDYFDPKEVEEKRKESGLRDKRAGITRALETLDPDNDAHWTQKGEPSLQHVFAQTSFEVSRGALREVWPDFDRKIAREIRKDKARQSAA